MEDKKKRISTEDTDKGINTELSESDSGVVIEEELTGVIIENKGQTSLEELLLEDDDEVVSKESGEDGVSYESSLAEYHALMHRAVTHADEEEGDSAKVTTEEATAEEEVDESEFLISLPTRKPVDENRRNEISLIPEEYNDTDGEAEILKDDALPVDEESYEEMLGQETVVAEENEDDFQLSFSFEDEKVVVKSEETPETEKKYDPDHPRIIDYIFDFVELFVFTLVAVIILTSFIFKHSVVEGGSMLTTLENGDHLIISDLFYTPERGDIIVFEDYSTFLKKAVVKRVIGLPGEVVEIRSDSRDTYTIYIDGEYYEEYNRKGAEYDSYHTGIWTVGEGEVFVLGDNRYDSTDSRHSGVGTIEIDSILGRVLFRFLPFNKFGSVN